MNDKIDSFDNHCARAVNRLRAAITELYQEIGLDPEEPQEISRRLGVNKTLTWQCSRLVQSHRPMDAVPFIPKPSSIEKVVQACIVKGANPQKAAEVRLAASEFDAVAAAHFGDRTTLGLIMDNRETPDGAGLALSCKLAFRGNSGIYGVQERTRLMSCYLAPNAGDSDRLDMAIVVGHIGLRRLRPTVGWPVYTVRSWADEGERLVTQSPEPIEPSDYPLPGLCLIPSMCRGRLPEIEGVRRGSSVEFVLKAGEIGNSGAFDCFHGDIQRAAVPRYRTPTDATGEFGAFISIPAENLVLDLIFHEALDFAHSAKALVFARGFGNLERTPEGDDNSRLPIRPRIIELGGQPPLVTTSLVPRYQELLARVAKRGDWDLSRFRGLRLHMKYPPLGTTFLLRFPMPERK